jgi:hypothetical protein
VFLAAVIFHLVIEQPERRATLHRMLKLGPPAEAAPANAASLARRKP